MNRFSVLLIILLFGVCIFLPTSLMADQYFPPTSSQRHFTAILNGLPGVVKIDWKTPVSMWVKVSSKAVGSPPSSEKAYTLAHILAQRGRTALYQPFCVHIYVKNDQEIGRDCVY